ncbi:MAG: hypothetical protein K2X29_14215 [Candidatus Obscuribacterales bacterium]|jgi:hypothetical protein|nr:hypothetical protein [Candidatus Obscuribacterales bacterium]
MAIWHFRIFVSAAVFVAAMGAAQLAIADEPQETAQNTAEQTSVDQSTTGSGTMLKGGVRGAVLIMEDGLQKMGESTTEIQKSTQMMMEEVTRKQTQTIRSPNVLPGGIVIQPFPGPSGTIQFGDLPARKKKIEYLMAQLEYHYKLLSNEVDALMIPEEKFPTIANEWNQIVAIKQEIGQNFDQLRDLTADPKKYNNDKIGKQALKIYDKTNAMDRLRRQVIKIVAAGNN